MFGSNWRFSLRKAILSLLIGVVFTWSLTGCSQNSGGNSLSRGSYQEIPSLTTTSIPQTKRLSEVSPPEVIQQLRHYLDRYQPQVTIVSPQPDEMVKDNAITVKLKVKDLPTFKDPKWGLGPHLHVFLDNQPYKAIYNLDEPLTFTDLEPGTHTLRVFASRPWHESFKNDGAYAQTTFHIFTKSEDNHPDPSLPLLTYSRPSGVYGAEPIMLDFYLTNAPLHFVAQQDGQDEIADWRIRVTINDESFILDQWQPIYLKGFQPGKNWVKLEFLDERGNVVKNAFNSTVRSITLEPGGQDTLSQLVRGELTVAEVGTIVDANYVAKTPPPVPVEVTPEPTPEPVVEVTPEPTPEPVVEVTPEPTPEPVVEVTPEPTPEPVVEVTPEPIEEINPEVETPMVVEQTPVTETQPVPEITEIPLVETQPTPLSSGETPEVNPDKKPKTPTTIKMPSQLTEFFNKAKEVKVGDWVNLDKIKQVNVGDWFNNTKRKLSDMISPSVSESPTLSEPDQSSP